MHLSDETASARPGLFSLTQIQHLMRVEFARSQRYGYPLSCLVLSIDDLVRVRERHGFDSKETVVRTVADVVRLETRTSDYLGRTPDDRLLCIVPHTSMVGLAVMGRRILERVQAVQFESPAGRYSVSLSIGASACEPGKTLFFDALLQAAEAALADARRDGGSCLFTRDVG